MKGVRSAFLLESAGRTTLVPRADQTAPLCKVSGRFSRACFFQVLGRSTAEGSFSPAMGAFNLKYCVKGRVEKAGPGSQTSLYASIFPAVWSFQLALRSRGIGSVLTTVHIHYEREVADLFNIPADVTQAALLPIAYFKGADFKPAPREPGSTRTHWNQWNRAS